MYRVPERMPNYHGLRLLRPSAVSGSTLLVYTEVIRSLDALPIRPPVIGARLILTNKSHGARIIKPILSVVLKVSYSIADRRKSEIVKILHKQFGKPALFNTVTR